MGSGNRLWRKVCQAFRTKKKKSPTYRNRRPPQTSGFTQRAFAGFPGPVDVVSALKEKHSTRVGWCIGRGWVLMLGKVFALSHVAGAKLSNPFVSSVARAWMHDEAKQEGHQTQSAQTTANADNSGKTGRQKIRFSRK